MKKQVPENIKRRIVLLNEIQNKISMEINKLLLGTEQQILVEGKSKTDPSVFTGRTRTNKIVHLSADKNLIGKFVNVEITETKSWTLAGNLKHII